MPYPTVKTLLNRLTDLCCVLNGFEGCNHGPLGEIHAKRRCNVMYAEIITYATSLYNNKVSLRRLTNAIQRAGWDDNYFVFDMKQKCLIIQHKD